MLAARQRGRCVESTGCVPQSRAPPVHRCLSGRLEPRRHRRDPPGVSRAFVHIKDGTLHVFPDAESRREYVAEFVEENRREGPATWEIVTFAATGLGRNSALVTARWVFRQPDDFVVWDFVDSYHLCWFDGRWEILVRTLHD
jgi:hypothetical protein